MIALLQAGLAVVIPLTAPGTVTPPHAPAPVHASVHPAAPAPVQPSFWLEESLKAYLADLDAGRPVSAAKQHFTAYGAFLRSHPGLDQPLDRTLTPRSAAWQAIALEKGPFVWNLVHQALDEGEFKALVHEAQQNPHQSPVALLQAHGHAAAALTSWLTTSGLPELRLESLVVTGSDGAYQVNGVLVQQGGGFGYPLQLALTSLVGNQSVSFTSFAARTPFHFFSATKPLRLMVDPQGHAPVRRHDTLSISEACRAADGVIVYGTHGTAAETEANRHAALALQAALKREHGLELPLKGDQELSTRERQGALLLVGAPATNAITETLEDQFPVRFRPDRALWWQGRSFARPGCGVVETVPNPENPHKTVLLLAGVGPEAIAQAMHFADRDATFCLYEGTDVLEEGQTLSTFPDLEAPLY